MEEIAGGASRLWQTPAKQEPGIALERLVDKHGNPPEHLNQRLFDKDSGRMAQDGLVQQVEFWSTPGVSRGDYTRTDGDPEKQRPKLSGEVKSWAASKVDNWATPAAGTTAGEHGGEEGFVNAKGEAPAPAPGDKLYRKDSGRMVQSALTTQVHLWTTPQAHDKHGARTEEQITEARLRTGGGNKNLNEDVRNWPSPTGEDSQSSRLRPSLNAGQPLNAVVKQWGTPSGQMAKDVGDPGSKSHTRRLAKGFLEAQVKVAGAALNPDWEELLMGWPLGWSDPARRCLGVWPGWPMPQGAEQFDYEPPRTIKPEKLRTKRVEMLGNGVVPQSAAAAFTVIFESCAIIRALTPTPEAP